MQRKLFNFSLTIFALALSFLLVGLAGNANATLQGRSPFVVYDDLLNITWTRNASLPGALT